MIIVESDLFIDIVFLQFCDLPPFLCNKRKNYKTCPLPSTLESSSSESLLARAAALMRLPAEERGVAGWWANLQQNKEIDPIPSAVLCLVLSNADVFDSSFIQKGFYL